MFSPKDVEDILSNPDCPVDLVIEDHFGDTTLLAACRFGRPQIVYICLQRGAKFDPHPRFGQTALHIASECGHEDCIRQILDFAERKGASVTQLVNVTDQSANCPLHLAALRGRTSCIMILLQRGADPEKVDRFGRTALFIAATAGHTECVALLCDKAEAFINLGDCRGDTALHGASSRGHLGCVRLLLQATADPTVNNKAGLSPIDLAKQHNHGSICDALIQAYARTTANAALGSFLPGHLDRAYSIQVNTPRLNEPWSSMWISQPTAPFSGIAPNFVQPSAPPFASAGLTGIDQANYISPSVDSSIVQTKETVPHTARTAPLTARSGIFAGMEIHAPLTTRDPPRADWTLGDTVPQLKSMPTSHHEGWVHNSYSNSANQMVNEDLGTQNTEYANSSTCNYFHGYYGQTEYAGQLDYSGYYTNSYYGEDAEYATQSDENWYGGQQFGEWIQYFTEENYEYYYNTQTGESVWAEDWSPELIKLQNLTGAEIEPLIQDDTQLYASITSTDASQLGNRHAMGSQISDVSDSDMQQCSKAESFEDRHVNALTKYREFDSGDSSKKMGSTLLDNARPASIFITPNESEYQNNTHKDFSPSAQNKNFHPIALSPLSTHSQNPRPPVHPPRNQSPSSMTHNSSPTGKLFFSPQKAKKDVSWDSAHKSHERVERLAIAESHTKMIQSESLQVSEKENETQKSEDNQSQSGLHGVKMVKSTADMNPTISASVSTIAEGSRGLFPCIPLPSYKRIHFPPVF